MFVQVVERVVMKDSVLEAEDPDEEAKDGDGGWSEDVEEENAKEVGEFAEHG